LLLFSLNFSDFILTSSLLIIMPFVLLQAVLFILQISKTLATPPSPQISPDYVLVATAENVTINCQTRYSVIFNGTTPGPALYMKENYTTWVRVYNQITDQNLTVVSFRNHKSLVGPMIHYPWSIVEDPRFDIVS
jgi:hypothetical protein